MTTFVVSKKGSKISELGTLLKLLGALSIENLENVDPTCGSGANLKEKKFLDDLELSWANSIQSLEVENIVLYNLQPHPNL